MCVHFVVIENSVTRETIQHDKVFWAMPDSYPKRQSFQLASNKQFEFFFLHTLPSPVLFKVKSEIEILRAIKLM